MIGVPMREPKTPPFEMVKVPPLMSSRVNLFSLALAPNSAIVRSISAKDILSTLRRTGTTREVGVETATEIST